MTTGSFSVTDQTTPLTGDKGKVTEENTNEVANLDGNEDPGPCSCCQKPIDEGQVILFNNKCWHPACFRCITCENLLDTNMNVYLDGDGNPICANCMHNCSICNQPITDFAMMYGKEMYHEECFRCQECHATISGTVYASTSKGVYCVNCHNERLARSRRHHEERKRRAKERAEKKSRQERERLSPNFNVDKSLPAPPPEPSPNLSISSISPVPLSEAAFQNHLMSGRPNGAAEDEIRSKGRSRSMSAVMETEAKLNGFSTKRESSSSKRESSKSKKNFTSKEEEVEAAYIPVVLDKSSLPNSPDPTQLENIIESPVLGLDEQSSTVANPQIQKIRSNEPIRSPPRQDTQPPSPLQRKTSISTMAKEATEAIGRKMSLRSRRKNSKANTESPEWKLEDIPRRRLSGSETPSSAPKSAIPDFPVPPSNASLSSVGNTVTEGIKSGDSNSPPVSPAQFMMRNDSVSEVSTAMTPTSLTFDGKTSPPNASASPPVPTRHPRHHSPKLSASAPLQSPDTATNQSDQSKKATTSPNKSNNAAAHNSKASTSYISLGSSRPSTAGSEDNPKTPQNNVSPTFVDSSPQLPSIPTTGVLSFEDEMSQMWLQHERQGSQESTSHKAEDSISSQSGGLLSKVTSSFRTNKINSGDQKSDQKSGILSRRPSKGHSKNTSQAGTLAATILADAEEEKAELRRQLRKSMNQIVELELKLKEDDRIESRLEGIQDALAGVETEREIALKELKVLLKYRYALQDSSKSVGTKETCDAILEDFELSLANLKDHMREQIREYTIVRTQLIEETARLRTLRDNYLEEATHLNKKNDELSDLNNDIQRNMDRTPNHSKSLSETKTGGGGGFSLFKQNKKDSPTRGSISSVQSILFNNDLAHPMYFEPKQSSEVASLVDSPVSRVSDSTIIPDESISQAVVTRVTDQDGSQLPPPPKKVNYWKKNTAALRKNAVKGFKSVWSGDTTILVSSPGTQISSPQLVSSTSQGNGMNILFPSQTSPAWTFDSYQAEVYKTHSFHPKAFKRWQKCGFCGEKLSGSEIRCIDCDYQCHTKCIMSVTVPCSKSRSKSSIRDGDSSSIASDTATLFGNDLSRQAEIEGRPVPYIVTRCIEEVEAHGMDYEGIYRKSGGASSLRAIVDAFEAGGEVNFDHLVGSGDICAVTSALKQYLRNLPDPLLPFSAYDRFLQAATGTDHKLRIAKFRGVLDGLPKVNYDTLQLLMLHLARVVARSDVNLMHANNLAVVFSPTIMRDMTGARQISDMQVTNMCIKFLIDNANILFGKRNPSLSLDRSSDAMPNLSRSIDHRI